VREPEFHVAAPATGRPLRRATLACWSAAAGLAGGGLATLAVAGLASLRRLREGQPLELVGELGTVLAPGDLGGAITLAGLLLVSLTAALGAAATLAARHGVMGPEGVVRPGASPPE
jgi:hypothetical protein